MFFLFLCLSLNLLFLSKLWKLYIFPMTFYTNILRYGLIEHEGVFGSHQPKSSSKQLTELFRLRLVCVQCCWADFFSRLWKSYRQNSLKQSKNSVDHQLFDFNFRLVLWNLCKKLKNISFVFKNIQLILTSSLSFPLILFTLKLLVSS